MTSNLTTTIDGATRVLDPAIGQLVVDNNLISLSKTFTDDPVTPGGTVTVEYTLTNLDPVNAINNISFTDDFDGALTGLAATGLPISVCGGNISGTGLLSFTGGTLAAGASCTFSVTLQTPASTPYGTIVNCPTSGVTGEIGGLPVIGDAANDDLQFQSLQLSKSIAGPVVPGETTIITFTITNFDPINSVNQVSFTDDLDAFISGMVATVLPPVGTCGPLSEVTGTSIINFGRGQLGPGQNCSFDVTVLVPCGTTPGNYTNTTSTLTGDGAFGSLEADVATNSITITEPAVLIAASSVTSTLACNGNTDGQITASASGGTPSYIFAWSNGATTATASGLSAGTYTVTVTDQNGCTDSNSTILMEPTVLIAASSVTSTLACNGNTDGQITASASGGTPSYIFAWSNGATTAKASGLSAGTLSAGTYTVTVTDQNGCTDSNSTILMEPTVLIAASSVTSTLACNGNTDGQITASASGGTPSYIFAWSNGATTAKASGLSAGTLSAGTYTVTVTDQNGCTDSNSTILMEPTVLIAASSVTSTLACNGNTDGQITASASGGTPSYIFAWSNGATTATASGLSAGTYTVTVTDQNGCTDSNSTILMEPTVLIAASSVTSTLACNGNTDGQITASASGGTPSYIFAWSNGATTATASGLSAGTYTVTVTDQNGCTDSNSTILMEPTVLIAASSVTSTLACNGNTDGQITASASGGTPSYIFAWSNGATTATASGLSAGTYTVTVTDQNGCTDSNSTILMEPTVLIAASSVTSPLACNGNTDGQITASASGGTPSYIFAWSNGATTATASGLSAGTYTVTVTDQNGCTDSNSTILMEPTVLIAASSVTSTLACNGNTDGQITASASGGTPSYIFAWSNGATTATASGLSAGTYTVTVTDQNGCTDSNSTILMEPTVLIAASSVTSTLACNGDTNGQITASASGGTPSYIFAWSNGATTATASGFVSRNLHRNCYRSEWVY